MQFPTIQEHTNLQQAVSARDLFVFLEVKDRFSVWIERMIGYGFVENQDYIGCRFYDTRANRDLEDFAISLDMAKEISMIQRSDKGKQARQYFIQCERRASQPVAPVFQIPTTLSEALQLASDQARQLELAQPKIAHYDAVVERNGLLNATQVSQKVRMSAVAMNRVLEELGVYSKAVKRSRVFQQWFVDQGFGLLKQTDMGHSQALFTKRGEAWVIERLVSEGVA